VSGKSWKNRQKLFRLGKSLTDNGIEHDKTGVLQIRIILRCVKDGRGIRLEEADPGIHQKQSLGTNKSNFSVSGGKKLHKKTYIKTPRARAKQRGETSGWETRRGHRRGT